MLGFSVEGLRVRVLGLRVWGRNQDLRAANRSIGFGAPCRYHFEAYHLEPRGKPESPKHACFVDLNSKGEAVSEWLKVAGLWLWSVPVLTVDTKKSCVTLSTLYFRNYGIIVAQVMQDS